MSKITIEVDTNDEESIGEALVLLGQMPCKSLDSPAPSNSVPVSTTAPAPVVDTPPPAAPVDTPPAAAPVKQGEVDSAGIPWDARIHAGNKVKTKTGVWKKRRGVDKATIEMVEAELINEAVPVDPAPAVTAPPPVDPAPAATTAPPPVADLPPPAATTAPPPVTPGAPVELTWPVMMQKIVNAQTAGTYSEERMTQLLGHFQIGEVALLSTRPDLWNAFIEDQYLGL